ncbi:hypothetical protein [Microcoleus sp. FACHB-831]|nr:hypothetical protein [Microcoleus sp. FACHB-831]
MLNTAKDLSFQSISIPSRFLRLGAGFKTLIAIAIYCGENDRSPQSFC